MDESASLAESFESHRTHLRAVAYRMLGSTNEADDAVQEAWLRLARSDATDIDNLGGWLTTVVARVALDMLRSRESRREDPMGESIAAATESPDPEHEAILGDSVGLAMLVVLQTLKPGERVAFVLHDMFGVSFDEISAIVGRSPAAARQLASRARRRVQGADPIAEADAPRKRKIVDAFLAAARGGDFAGLLALLDPEVVLRADTAAVQTGAQDEVRGASAVAETFSGRARVAQPALVNGSAGAVWAVGGKPRVVFAFSIEDAQIVEIELIADERSIGELDLEILG
ncbi:MAG: sigma-70 family RNA polymerase sigma factor [Actinomycetota bacterium]